MKKRLLALLTVLCMLLSMLPATAFAKTVEPLEPVYISQYNPLYGEPDEGITLEQYAPVTLADHAFEGQNYPDDREQVVATLRTGLEARQNTITFNYFLDGDTYDGSEAAGEAMLSGLFASALEHTGEPTEGDYIHWVYEKMSAGSNGYIYGGDYYLTITFTMTYYTTAAQEQAVTDRLATVMPSFGFTAETDDYTKVKTIYDYICDNVVYDNTNLKDDSYKLKYTAYAALINGTSVCQGYAVLLYRMLLMAGVDNRVITGISNGGNHAWNIIKLGEYYYDADSTWDAGETEYDYFLRCPANFDPTHTRHDEYNTAAFNTAYPMADADYDPLSNTEFAGGTGVEGNPYLISTKTHLNNVRNYLGAHFKMVNDIVFTDADFASGGDFYNGGAGWEPIGDSISHAFTGTFDGNGYAVKNLYVNKSTSSSVFAGLFGFCSGATIKNLGMVDSDITAASANNTAYIGGIAGIVNGGTVTNCYNTGSVSATSTASYSGAQAGGIAGYVNGNGTVTNCYNTGSVKGTASYYSASTGGIVGYVYGDCTVTNCYNSGTVYAYAKDSCAGGITGEGTGGIVTNCYNTGSTTASGNMTAHAGGIVSRSVTVTNCYNIGVVKESCAYTNYAGGIAGSCGTVTNCYYLDNIDKGVGRYTDAATKCTAAQLKQQSTFSGFDFTTVWTMAGSTCYPYPELRAIPVPAAHDYENGYCTVCGLPEGLTYTVSGDNVTITGYTGSLTELTVPETINGKTVTALDAGGAFQHNTTLKKVTLPDTLTAFGAYTFYGCSALESVNIPAGVKSIGGYSFANCTALKSITIPEGVTEIGVHAFYQSGLTSVTVPNSVTSVLGGAFSYCKSLTDVTLGSGLTVLPTSLFSGCSALKTLTIPANVTTIGDEAFQFCTALEYITIPHKVTDIGDRAFYNCAALTKITLNGDLPIFGTSCFTSTTATALYPCDNDTWTDTLVANLASAYPSVTWTAAHDPKTVSGTPNSCFTGGISDGVQCTICEEWLTPQTPVPAGHKLIVDGYCTVCGLPEGLLYTVSGDTVTVTDYTGSLTELTIPAAINGKTVTAIDNYAFDGCVRLKRITLPDSVTSIGKFAFMSCSSLENVNIPDGVNAINHGTFSGCSALKTVSLPAHIGSIGDNAFDGCTGLERITLPNSVTTIGMYAFESCGALKSITIPEDVIDIGKYAFYRCGSLDTVRFLGNAPTIGSGCFSGVTADAYYPCGDTWTENKLQSYGGSISWTVEHNYVGGFCTGCGAAEPTVEGVYRLAGSNRFDTAFKSADALKEVMGVDKFPAAIVTSGMNFADALAGSYLAARTGAPILLTDNDNMADVIAYILANVEEGGTVYALGGSSIVSDTLRAVEDEGYTFKRLAGASRFETNLLILEEAGIDSGDSVLVCTAYNFADSLSASALGMPILLVDDTVSAAQMAFLEENADGEFILVGGTGAVKPAVEQQLREKWDVVRLAGASRFDTSVLTAIEAFGSSGVDYAVLAYGYNFPDGLCAGPLAYALGAPLILTANGDEGAAVEYATAAGITDGFVLGGPSLIDDTVTRAIFSMTAGDSIQR